VAVFVGFVLSQVGVAERIGLAVGEGVGVGKAVLVGRGETVAVVFGAGGAAWPKQERKKNKILTAIPRVRIRRGRCLPDNKTKNQRARQKTPKELNDS